METFFVSLALCEGNPLATSGFPSYRPVTRSFDLFFDLYLNKRLSKQSRHRWFEMSSRSLWCYCNGMMAVDHVIRGMQFVICKTPLGDLAKYSSKHNNKNMNLKNLAQYRTILYGITLQIWVYKTHHVLTINNNLLSQMRQFSTGFHEWNSHEW